MFDYDYRIIEIFLDKFKVNDVVFNGLSSNNDLVEFVLKYCNDNDINISLIDSNATTSKNVIKGNELNILKNFKDFDAIFINGDSNWYTVYNELNIIKKNNVEFPLVLICNNLFPNMPRFHTSCILVYHYMFSNHQNIPYIQNYFVHNVYNKMEFL